MPCPCPGYQAMSRELERLRAIAAVPLLRSGFDLSSDTHARMIARLHRAAPGAFVRMMDLEDAMAADFPNENTIRVYVNRLRKRIGDDFIETGKPHEGYRLSENARAMVAKVLAGDE